MSRRIRELEARIKRLERLLGVPGEYQVDRDGAGEHYVGPIPDVSADRAYYTEDEWQTRKSRGRPPVDDTYDDEDDRNWPGYVDYRVLVRPRPSSNPAYDADPDAEGDGYGLPNSGALD